MNAFERTVLLLTMTLAGFVSAAAHPRDRGFELRRHELTVSAGICPGRYAFGYNHTTPFSHSTLSGAYEMAKYYENEFISGAWSMGYTYNFTKLLAVQANISYEEGWIDRFRRSDGGLSAKSDDMYLSALAAFKVYWFNRPCVRMYSHIGLGISFNRYYNDPIEALGQGERVFKLVPAWQIAPLGIMVGRKFFGFAEIGIGTCFAGGSVGIGYRF